MNENNYVVQYTTEQLQLLKNTIARDTNDNEFSLFLYQCKRTGLDPFARQIYCIKRAGQCTTQISIDGARLIAERSGKYAGQLGPLWCGEDGVWFDAWLKKYPPTAAKVGILRTDFKEPIWSIANFDAYKATGPMWTKMPALMCAKCAEALGLRRAFPMELSGLYTEDEIVCDDVTPQIQEKVAFNFAKEDHKQTLRTIIKELKIDSSMVKTHLNELVQALHNAPFEYETLKQLTHDYFKGA